jgi:hypothetical protein
MTEPQAVAITEKELEDLEKNPVCPEDKTHQVPASVRRNYGLKVWLLVAFQMACSFGIALLFYTVLLPNYADPDKSVLDRILWVVIAAVAAMGSLGALLYFRDKAPFNYFILIVLVIPSFGFFWGATKYFIAKNFGLQVLGVVTTSLVLGAICHASGLTNCLGKLLQPKGVSSDANFFMEATTKDQLEEAFRNSTKYGGAVDPDRAKADLKRVMDMRKIADGHFRATIIMSWLIWLIAQGGNIYLVEKVYPQDMWYVDHIFTCVFTFFMCTYFHFDCERQMRLCKVDDYMKILVNVNAGLLFWFTIFFVIVMILFSAFNSNNAGAMMKDGEGAPPLAPVGLANPEVAAAAATAEAMAKNHA